MSRTARALLGVILNEGITAAARSLNRRTASLAITVLSQSAPSALSPAVSRAAEALGRPRDGTWNTTSPSSPSASRLEARIAVDGLFLSTRSASSAAPAITCSQLSTRSRSDLLLR